ncbi:uncharacterized protein LOC129750956 [Uranotaenia lowii]|uniref:uncharacterized protein LOC129750956 n=1 Tax=Uranotaenia lowii TaxID=190385 RepID=UPI00247A6241|nr:uncharacterized protein LOC129750956 [Uranotaenia lowii]
MWSSVFFPGILLLISTAASDSICTVTLSSPEQLDGCSFSPLIAMADQSGWTLSKPNCGQTVTADLFEVPPILFFDFAEPEKLYTLVFVDLDGASSSTSSGQSEDKMFLHWIVVNVPEAALMQGMTSSDGDIVMDYLPPSAASYEHRFGFYLYEQAFGTCYPPMPNSREDFSLTAWIQSIYPEGTLCGPVGAIGFNL